MTWWAMLVVWPLGYLVGRQVDELGYWALALGLALGLATYAVDKRLARNAV